MTLVLAFYLKLLCRMVIQQLENSIYLVISITISELDRITCFLWCYIITTAEAAAGSRQQSKCNNYTRAFSIPTTHGILKYSLDECEWPFVVLERCAHSAYAMHSNANIDTKLSFKCFRIN